MTALVQALPPRWRPVAKAVVALLVAGLAVAGTALADGTVTGPETVGIVLAVLGAGGATWATPNVDVPDKHAPDVVGRDR